MNPSSRLKTTTTRYMTPTTHPTVNARNQAGTTRTAKKSTAGIGEYHRPSLPAYRLEKIDSIKTIRIILIRTKSKGIREIILVLNGHYPTPAKPRTVTYVPQYDIQIDPISGKLPEWPEALPSRTFIRVAEFPGSKEIYPRTPHYTTPFNNFI